MVKTFRISQNTHLLVLLLQQFVGLPRVAERLRLPLQLRPRLHRHLRDLRDALGAEVLVLHLLGHVLAEDERRGITPCCGGIVSGDVTYAEYGHNLRHKKRAGIGNL